METVSSLSDAFRFSPLVCLEFISINSTVRDGRTLLFNTSVSLLPVGLMNLPDELEFG